ncbi:hypothetical protein NHP214377_12670 [Helicobacter ailurogastricus]|nr:hypothetical protein NHP214377_12670 [Helicobacter ailurogastricus]
MLMRVVIQEVTVVVPPLVADAFGPAMGYAVVVLVLVVLVLASPAEPVVVVVVLADCALTPVSIPLVLR